MPAPTDPLAQYTARRTGPWNSLDIAHACELQEVVAAEIKALTGCSDDVASLAGGAFVNCRSMPGFGLDASASGDPLRVMRASAVLGAWVASKRAHAVEAA